MNCPGSRDESLRRIFGGLIHPGIFVLRPNARDGEKPHRDYQNLIAAKFLFINQAIEFVQYRMPSSSKDKNLQEELGVPPIASGELTKPEIKQFAAFFLANPGVSK